MLGAFYKAEEFDEALHPRDEDGRFSSGGGGPGGGVNGETSVSEMKGGVAPPSREDSMHAYRWANKLSSEDQQVLRSYVQGHMAGSIENFIVSGEKDRRLESLERVLKDAPTVEVTALRSINFESEQARAAFLSNPMKFDVHQPFTTNPREAEKRASGKFAVIVRARIQGVDMRMIGSAVDETSYGHEQEILTKPGPGRSWESAKTLTDSEEAPNRPVLATLSSPGKKSLCTTAMLNELYTATKFNPDQPCDASGRFTDGGGGSGGGKTEEDDIVDSALRSTDFAGAPWDSTVAIRREIEQRKGEAQVDFAADEAKVNSVIDAFEKGGDMYDMTPGSLAYKADYEVRGAIQNQKDAAKNLKKVTSDFRVAKKNLAAVEEVAAKYPERNIDSSGYAKAVKLLEAHVKASTEFSAKQKQVTKRIVDRYVEATHTNAIGLSSFPNAPK